MIAAAEISLDGDLWELLLLSSLLGVLVASVAMGTSWLWRIRRLAGGWRFAPRGHWAAPPRTPRD